ncbi:nicotinate phosphoribosyltransferase [Acholeplasma sp. OttesenSCG-928-E16]|nr:nicotinate phosphoribosyltransferase [Acholeplasma sp. OttesenSCG-928-E16]
MRNFSLLLDYYELTMAYSYYCQNKHEDEAVFDVFFRDIPDKGGYAIYAGLEQIIDYINTFKFQEEELDYLRKKNTFSEDFISYLKELKMSLTIYSMKEGTPIFPNEPIMIVRGPLLQCQLVETFILLTLNHQSLIATKASRITMVSKGRTIMEFGARRAQGYDAANYGARAAYIGGVFGTSNTYADYLYDIPALGTMAHSYVQSYKTEYEAFLAYAKTYPNNTVLLVDTYNTLKKGIPNAIRVHNEFLKPNGYYLKGIRIDSGDLAYLSIEARKLLDAAGLFDTKITVSNSLDEYSIRTLLNQGACIDSFGVGERLITAKSDPVFGGVFKLSALMEDGILVPKIKISDNVQKMTTPGFKQVHRMYDENNKAIGDVVTLFEEVIDDKKPYLLFDPLYPWKQKEITNYKSKKLLETIFLNGKLVYQKPDLIKIRDYAKESLDTLWKEMTRLEFPHQYYVDLSQELWDLKQSLIVKHNE